MLANLQFFLSETWSNLTRSRHTTVITILQTLVSLFVLGIFLVIIISTNRFVSSFLNNLVVAVFLDDSLGEEEQIALMKEITTMQGVKQIEYISKDDAKKWMAEHSKFEFEDVIADHNPLPASFRLYITSPRVASGLAGAISSLQGVTDVRYGEEELQQKLPTFYFLLISCFLLALIIAAATIFTISNTIRLAIYARRKEIKIMQLVGATDWAIKAPFILEGLVYGLLGGFLAFIVISFGYTLVYTSFQADWLFRPFMVEAGMMAYNLLVLMVVLGALIGTAGSLISVDRYLENGYEPPGTVEPTPSET